MLHPWETSANCWRTIRMPSSRAKPLEFR
jgi:hypothetical protein